MGSSWGVMVEPWGRGWLALWKAKELWKAHCKSCYFSYTMFQTQTNLIKKVCVQKQTLNHFVNPTLDFTFLQWSSHSFIQIPKVEIICSKCFRSRPAEGFNDFSRAGENCKIFYTLTEHSEWKMRERKKQREREKECFDDLFVYFVTVMALWQCLRRHADCQCLISFGKVAFLLYYGDDYDGEIVHTIIHFLQDGEQAHFKETELGDPWGWCVYTYAGGIQASIMNPLPSI